MKTSDRAHLEEKLGHRFANPDLLARALTHASAVAGSARKRAGELSAPRIPRRPRARPRHRRRADRALSRGAGRASCRGGSRGSSAATPAPRWRTRWRSREHLKIGGGVARAAPAVTPGVLADVCEAVIAAVYRDGGLEPARELIERFWGPRIETMRGPLRDAKTELQEWAHRRGFERAELCRDAARRARPPARNSRSRSLSARSPPGRGKGGSKREAEHEAAAGLLRREGVWSKA